MVAKGHLNLIKRYFIYTLHVAAHIAGWIQLYVKLLFLRKVVCNSNTTTYIFVGKGKMQNFISRILK